MKPLTPFWSLIVSTLKKSFHPKFRFLYPALGLLPVAGQLVMRSLMRSSPPVFVVMLLVFGIASLWFVAYIYKTNFYTLTDQNISIRKTVGHLFAVLFLTGLITLFGFLLFIIPGLIFLVWFSFAAIIAVIEGKGVSAIKESKALVAGRFWPVAGRLFVLSILTNVPRAWLGPFWSITTPYFSLIAVSLYLDLKK